MDLTKYAALSFDCYGTLIDWETGILGVLRPWATERGLGLDDEQLLLDSSVMNTGLYQHVTRHGASSAIWRAE